MPRISELPELPENAKLTGAGRVAVVQNGETLQVSIATLLTASLPAAAVNARWIRSSADTAFINNATVDLVLPPQAPAS